MFYRKRLLIGLILSLSFLFTSPAFAESYTSIQQIVETTPERWTETYETNGVQFKSMRKSSFLMSKHSPL